MLFLLMSVAEAGGPPHPVGSMRVPDGYQYLAPAPEGAVARYLRRFHGTGNTPYSWFMGLWFADVDDDQVAVVAGDLVEVAEAAGWTVQQESDDAYRIARGGEQLRVELSAEQIRNNKIIHCNAVLLTYFAL